MRRLGTVTVLSVAGVLLAAGAAAALNTRVLGPGTKSPVGVTERFVPLDEQPAASLTPAPDPGSAEGSEPAEATTASSTPAAVPSRSSATRPAGPAASSRPSRSASASDDHGGKDDSSKRPTPRPSDDSHGSGSSSDGDHDDD